MTTVSSEETATVVIPTWNGLEHLRTCLPAVVDQTCKQFNIVVVDNGSTDGTVRWLRETYPAVTSIALDHNYGFAAACNAGIRATASPYIALLNNDTIPHPEWLSALLHAVNQWPDVGAFASTLYLDEDPPLVDAAGIGVDRLGVAWNVARGELIDKLPREVRPVWGPCAGAALYRRTMLDDIGLFDESFFAYLEDAELAWRARWAGWACLWIPGSSVQHAHSATGGRTPPFKYWLLGRNRIWMFLRHYPRPHLWRYATLMMFNEIATGVLGSAALRHPAPLLGRLAALRQWRKAIRPAHPTPPRIPATEIFEQLTPISSLTTIWSRYRQGRGIPFPQQPSRQT